eukprot:31934_1
MPRPSRFAAGAIFTGLVGGALFTSGWYFKSKLIWKFALPSISIHILLAAILKYVNQHKNPKTRLPKLPLIAYSITSLANAVVQTSILNSIHNQYSTNTTYSIAFMLEYMHIALFLDIMNYLTNPGKRSLLYRIFINWPASIHFTILFLKLCTLPIFPILSKYNTYQPCLIIYILYFLISLYGIHISLNTKWTHCNVKIPYLRKHHSLPTAKPMRVSDKAYIINSNTSHTNGLKICQITDCHLGALCTVERLQQICKDILAHNPDLIILTGDYFTGEAHVDNFLYNGLLPLKKYSNKCFACLGNHDMEDEIVLNRTMKELNMLGIKLLRDESIVFNSCIGPIQIIGYDYLYFRNDRKSIIDKVMNNNICPKECKGRRIVLLHDPGSFKYFENNENVMVFSGHTHGGHVGIKMFGINKSMLNLIGVPDNGLWNKGNNFVYVHRGQGSRALYGNLLLRIGIPTEQACVTVSWE